MKFSRTECLDKAYEVLRDVKASYRPMADFDYEYGNVVKEIGVLLDAGEDMRKSEGSRFDEAKFRQVRELRAPLQIFRQSKYQKTMSKQQEELYQIVEGLHTAYDWLRRANAEYRYETAA